MMPGWAWEHRRFAIISEMVVADALHVILLISNSVQQGRCGLETFGRCRGLLARKQDFGRDAGAIKDTVDSLQSEYCAPY